jgi:hypothetical protein
MAFFARPNLDNIQFKQLPDTTLTLSGQTQIATTSGLTLTDGEGGYVPIVATGKQNNYVLTYDGVEDVIKLKESTASGGIGVYPYDESSTIAIGGLSANTYLYNENVVDILQEILVPTLNPTLTNPSISSFTINPNNTIYEVGSNITISATAYFNPGVINPQYTSLSSCRSNGTQYYEYMVQGVITGCTTNSPSNTYPLGSVDISDGNNLISSKIYYCSGVQPYDSAGAIYDSPLVAGATTPSQKTICGTYPWYWGIESSGDAASGVNRPTSTCIKSLITGGTANKCVDLSNNTLYVQFNSTSDDYLWFATPVGSTTKTCWYETALNSGLIGGNTNLFPNAIIESDIYSSSPVWSGQSYQIYISNYQSASSTPTSIMELRNS